MNLNSCPLFTKTSGQGEPLLVLHGWGMNHHVWTPIQSALEDNFRVTWVDLPGHGQSREVALDDLDTVVDHIINILGENPTHIMGWSLGGLIAQRLAQRVAQNFPDLVKSLLLIATSPSFVERDNWLHAMPANTLDSFIQRLESDFKLTIKQFLLLQFMGVKGVQSEVKKLRDDIRSAPPSMTALRDGLSILKDTDLRDAVINCPQYWVLGELDKLVPASVAEDVARGIAKNIKSKDQSTVTIIKGAGHAPFISHSDEFVSKIWNFMQQHSLGSIDG